MSTDPSDPRDHAGHPTTASAVRSALSATARIAAPAWAAPLLKGGKVLLVQEGPGDATGRLLLDRGVARVVAILPPGPVLETAAGLPTDALEFRPGHPDDVPLKDDEVDAVVWPEVPDDLNVLLDALPELLRVLRLAGHLVLGLPPARSAEPRAVHPGLEAVGVRLPFVAVAESRSHMASVVTAGPSGGPVTMAHLGAGSPERLLVCASARRVETPPAVAVLDGVATFDRWEAQALAARDAELARLSDELAELRQVAEERRYLQDALLEAETELADVPDLRETIGILRNEVTVLKTMVSELEQRVDRGDRTVRDMQSSFSWQLTRPIRQVKRVAG